MTTNTPAENLADLINGDRVRSSIRRLFENKISACLGELFQNSQRARAAKVEITTYGEEGFTYRDDGHGILGGVNGFHTLLRIAESHFDNETITDQDPMGLGIHALLAHDQISSVTFASGMLSLKLDTKRWWEDKAYYTGWYKQVEELTIPVEGFEVAVECTEKLTVALKRSLTDPTSTWSDAGPAQGYEGILEITLDGKSVDTRLPRWVRVEQPLIETTYMGSRLLNGFQGEYRQDNSSVNWYGQIIKIDFYSGFVFHLNVREGKPVNPLSPSRRGLIKDAAYERLIQFVKDELFRFLFAPENREQIRPEYVSGYYRLDAERAHRDAPYFVAARLLALDSPDSLEDLDQKGDDELFTYDTQPRLLREGVSVIDDEGTVRVEDYGLASFLSMLGDSYHLEHGDEGRLLINALWWKPGKHTRLFFSEPGEYGIGDGDAPPAAWHKVDHTPVFAFSDCSNWDVASIDWTVGTSDIVGFLLTQAWAGFNPENEKYDADEMREYYEKSLQNVLCEVIGNCVPVAFTIGDLQRFMPTKAARIKSVRYHYPDVDVEFPDAVTVMNARGEEVRLRLLQSRLLQSRLL